MRLGNNHRNILADSLSRSVEPGVRLSPYHKESDPSCWLLSTMKEEEDLILASPELEGTLKCVKGRKLCITSRGYLALAHWGSRDGDIVVVFPSEAVPYGLRKSYRGWKIYEFIGEWWVSRTYRIWNPLCTWLLALSMGLWMARRQPHSIQVNEGISSMFMNWGEYLRILSMSCGCAVTGQPVSTAF